MIGTILKATFVYINKKLHKIAEDEKRLHDLEKDVGDLGDKIRGREAFTDYIRKVDTDIEVIKNDIKHLSDIINKLDERMERRRMIVPVEFDRRQG